MHTDKTTKLKGFIYQFRRYKDRDTNNENNSISLILKMVWTKWSNGNFNSVDVWQT